MFDFQDKAVIVTGAASGIGKATAEYFFGCGARVLLADIDEDRAKQTAATLDPQAKRARAVGYDAALPTDAVRVVDACVAQWGRLDSVVASAGVHQTHRAAEMPDEVWRRTLSINLDGVFYLVRSAVPHLSTGGAVVAVASTAGHKGGTIGHAHYGAAKGGVLALTRGLAREFWPRIRVNAVSPGLIDTPMMEHAIHGDGASGSLNYGRPEQVASVIAFLCSDAASFVTGETILVTGGEFMA